MLVLSDVFAAIAVLALATIYGAEVFAMVVLRPALAHGDEATLSTTMGRIHQYGDRRLSAFFIVGLLAAILSGVGLGGRTGDRGDRCGRPEFACLALGFPSHQRTHQPHPHRSRRRGPNPA
jgi:hypothetical protein